MQMSLFDTPVKTAPVAQIVDSASLRQWKKKFNFFETPEALADKMADLCGPAPMILEPSAGRGALIHAVKRSYGDLVDIHFCEIQDVLCQELSEFKRVGTRFEDLHAPMQYDAVIMNPPYKDGLAFKHVDLAWNCIKLGGRIVALVDAASAQKIDDEFMGYVFHKEEIKRGFSETSITTYLYLIHKPLY